MQLRLGLGPLTGKGYFILFYYLIFCLYLLINSFFILYLNVAIDLHSVSLLSRAFQFIGPEYLIEYLIKLFDGLDVMYL